MAEKDVPMPKSWLSEDPLWEGSIAGEQSFLNTMTLLDLFGSYMAGGGKGHPFELIAAMSGGMWKGSIQQRHYEGVASMPCFCKIYYLATYHRNGIGRANERFGRRECSFYDEG
jgi:hypothetical protein